MIDICLVYNMSKKVDIGLVYNLSENVVQLRFTASMKKTNIGLFYNLSESRNRSTYNLSALTGIGMVNKLSALAVIGMV